MTGQEKKISRKYEKNTPFWCFFRSFFADFWAFCAAFANFCLFIGYFAVFFCVLGFFISFPRHSCFLLFFLACL
jgi:hypothetical protein